MNAKHKDVYRQYSEYLMIKGLTKNTVTLYLKEAKELLEHVRDIELITTLMANNYFKRYSKLSHVSKNLHYAFVRAFLRFLSKNVYLYMNRVSIRNIRVGRRLPKMLDSDEFMRRLDFLKDRTLSSNNWIFKRNYALIMLLYSTGMRVSEALTFNMNNLEDNWVRIDNGKGSKDRYVPIAQVAVEALKKYADSCPHAIDKDFFISYQKTGLSRISAYKMLKHSMGLSPHDMRHHFATHMIINGCDMSIVGELLGHSSLTTTQIYTHIRNPQLAETVNECHPMANYKYKAVSYE